MFHHRLAFLGRRALSAFVLVTLIAATAPAEAGANRNGAPTIAGSPATSATVGTAYEFQPTASDQNGDRLIFRISGKPAWATFSTATGRLSGTPRVAGTYASIVIRVTDGKVMVLLPAFSITVKAAVVAPVNAPPAISGAAVTVGQVDRPYAFQPVAADPDNDALTFSISGKPSWATFDPGSGTLYGTPTATDVGTYSGIVISVSDGKLIASLGAFAIKVAAAPTRSVTLSWAAPTTNTDGSALTDLAGYVVLYGTAPRSYSTTLQITGAGTSSVVLEGFSPGTYYFTVKSRNNAGIESDFANEVVTQL
jgi:hypothetical protein